MPLFRPSPDQPTTVPKTTEWLTLADCVEEVLPKAGQLAMLDVWNRLVGEAWLGKGARIEGQKVTMALCAEGFRDEWCVAAGDLPIVRAEAARAQVEYNRRSRHELGPLAATPKTAKWLTQRQVANALGLPETLRPLDDLFRDLTTACWEGTKPRLTRAKLRVAPCSVKNHQTWCLHADDMQAFVDALKAVASEQARIKPPPDGWLTIYKLAAMTRLSDRSLAQRWRESRPFSYEAAGEPREMLSPVDAYKVAWSTALDMGVQAWLVPAEFQKEEFTDADAREQANELLAELAEDGTTAVLGPVGLRYEIGRTETRGRRNVPYIHPECLARFKSEMQARAFQAVDAEASPAPFPK